MNAFDIVVVALISAAASGVIGWLIYRKVKGKGGCCGCSNCSGGNACRKSKKED